VFGPSWIRVRSDLAVRQSDPLRSQRWSFASLAVGRGLSLVVMIFRRRESKEIEFLVLRHRAGSRRADGRCIPIAPCAPSARQRRLHWAPARDSARDTSDECSIATSATTDDDHRPHRGLALRPPVQPASSRPAQIKRIRQQEVRGGLINEYHAA
jgi:hypothetical protein